VKAPIKRDALTELAQIRAALLEQRHRAEALAAAERERVDDQRDRVAAERREQELFASAVGAVVPLRKIATPALARAQPPAIARQRQRDEAAALLESISDAFDVESLLETDDALSFRRRGVGIDIVRKLRRGVWVLQDEIDLHGLRSDAARERVAEFVRDSARAGLRCIRVVHGKGLGSPGREPVLKAKVKSWLVQRSEVLAFTHARPADGGHGALIVLLSPAPRDGRQGSVRR
jgi:DNA-nicking Smr family endonuclease